MNWCVTRRVSMDDIICGWIEWDRCEFSFIRGPIVFYFHFIKRTPLHCHRSTRLAVECPPMSFGRFGDKNGEYCHIEWNCHSSTGFLFLRHWTAIEIDPISFLEPHFSIRWVCFQWRYHYRSSPILLNRSCSHCQAGNRFFHSDELLWTEKEDTFDRISICHGLSEVAHVFA